MKTVFCKFHSAFLLYLGYAVVSFLFKTLILDFSGPIRSYKPPDSVELNCNFKKKRLLMTSPNLHIKIHIIIHNELFKYS